MQNKRARKRDTHRQRDWLCDNQHPLRSIHLTCVHQSWAVLAPAPQILVNISSTGTASPKWSILRRCPQMKQLWGNSIDHIVTLTPLSRQVAFHQHLINVTFYLLHRARCFESGEEQSGSVYSIFPTVLYHINWLCVSTIAFAQFFAGTSGCTKLSSNFTSC